jgi:hypothetical protein
MPETVPSANVTGPTRREALIVTMDRNHIHFTGLQLSGSESLERRRQIRFGLRAPVHFSWADRDGVHKGDGFSRDISSHGVYVYAEWRAQPERDADIEVDIVLHSFSEAQRALHMSGRAKIIRVEPSATDEHSGGFVAESDSFVFKEGQNQNGEA